MVVRFCTSMAVISLVVFLVLDLCTFDGLFLLYCRYSGAGVIGRLGVRVGSRLRAHTEVQCVDEGIEQASALPNGLEEKTDRQDDDIQ